jgi:hypothetical protein
MISSPASCLVGKEDQSGQEHVWAGTEQHNGIEDPRLDLRETVENPKPPIECSERGE